MINARRIRTVVLAALALPGAWLLALGPRADDDMPPQRVIVDYWEKWGGAEGAAMQEAVDAFNATVGADKAVYVRYLSMSNIEKKTLVSIAAGAPPDIAGLFDAQLAQYAAQDALLELDDLAKEYGLTADKYKKVYRDTCTYDHHLYALPAVPAAVALHYNKQIFRDEADKLRAAGLDPYRPPRTLDELDRYAMALDARDPRNSRILLRSGFIPLYPDWFLNYNPYWFGGDLFDAKNDRFTFTSEPVVRSYEWMRSYAVRLGPKSTTEFTSSFGAFASAQNPFLTGQIVMCQQGPWMANYIHLLAPHLSEVIVPKCLEPLLPPVLREHNYAWGVEAFPSAVEGLHDVTFCGLDLLTIPRGAKHPREAFEFLVFISRQDVMERLCAAQCKHSPLKQVSEQFIRNHPNPYIAVFERLAASPNAKGPQQIPILPEVTAEVAFVNQSVYALAAPPEVLLREAQRRLEEKYAQYKDRRAARHALAAERAR